MESKHIAITIILIVIIISIVLVILISQKIASKRDVLMYQSKQKKIESIVIHKNQNIIIKEHPLVSLLTLAATVVLHRISTKRIANNRTQQSTDSATINDFPISQ